MVWLLQKWHYHPPLAFLIYVHIQLLSSGGTDKGYWLLHNIQQVQSVPRYCTVCPSVFSNERSLCLTCFKGWESKDIVSTYTQIYMCTDQNETINSRLVCSCTMNIWSRNTYPRILDHSGHSTSKEPTNPPWEIIDQFIWCTMIRVISHHWSWSGSSQRNAP